MLFTLVRHKTRILWNQFTAWKGKVAGPLIILFYLVCSLIIGSGIAELMGQAKTWFPQVFLPWIACFLLIYGLITVFLSDLIIGHTLNWGQMSTDHRLLITLPITYPTLLFLKLYERLLTDITGVMLLGGSFIALTTMSGITFANVVLGLLLFVQVELVIGLLVNLASVVIQRLLPPSGVANTFSLLGYISAVVVLLPYIWFSNNLPLALSTLYDLYTNWGSRLEWILAPFLLVSGLLTMPFDWIHFLKWQGAWITCLAAGMILYNLFGQWQWLTWTHSGIGRRRHLELQMFSGIFRKELLLLKSDFNLLTNALLLPFSIIFLEVWVFRDYIMTGKLEPAMNAMSGAIFYFCLFGPLNTVGNERGAIALLENLPLGVRRWLFEKTRFWNLIALSFFLPASLWMGHELGLSLSNIVLLATWTLIYSLASIWIAISFSGLFANFQAKVLQQGSTISGKVIAALGMGMLITAKSLTPRSVITWILFLIMGVSLRKKAVEVLDARLDSERYHQPPFRPLDVLLYWLFLAGLTISLGSLLYRFSNPSAHAMITQALNSMCAIGTIFLLAAVLVEHRNARLGLSFADFGLRPGTGTAVLQSVVILLGIGLFLLFGVHDATPYLTTWSSPGISQYLLFDSPWWFHLLCLLAGGFLLPLVEETFFRGMIIPAAQTFFSSDKTQVAALLVSAAGMTLIQPTSYMSAAFLQSLVCGWWYLRSGSIIPGLLLRGGIAVMLMVHCYLHLPP